MERWDRFTLRYESEPSGRYKDIRQGYWIASANSGSDADGLTPEAAMAALIIELDKAVEYWKDEAAHNAGG